MGTFLSTLGNITIAEADRDEFREMYMKVATAGGMMEVEEIKIFDNSNFPHEIFLRKLYI